MSYFDNQAGSAFPQTGSKEEVLTSEFKLMSVRLRPNQTWYQKHGF